MWIGMFASTYLIPMRGLRTKNRLCLGYHSRYGTVRYSQPMKPLID